MTTDHPKSVRKGEELDSDSLANYLEKHILDFQGPIQVQQFPSGFSNLTYCISSKGKQWVLRRPPFGSKVKTAHDMGREFFILSRLENCYPVPKAVLYCEDENVIGAPFYLMERISGVILRKDTEIKMTEETAVSIGTSFVDHLIKLHNIDYHKQGLQDWGKPQGYVERQVTGWSKRYRKSQTDDVAEIEVVIEWLQSNIPETQRNTIIHNDYKYDNLVLDPGDLTNILGVLDWEMATIGDPLMDLGTVLGYWINYDDPADIQKLCIVPTNISGSLKRNQIVEYYAKQTSLDTSQMLFYYCFAVFKIIVIAQQIYYRYKQGLTKDARFAALIHYVRGFAKIAQMSLKTGKF